MADIQRSFIIGDEWLYYKIYTGSKTADLVLTDIIKPVATQLIENGNIDSWFFIRYNDPKHHIRVRFHYNKPSDVATIINELYTSLKEFVDQDLIWKIQLDTYQREIERYGIQTMELSEKLFFLDSTMMVNFIDMIDGDEGEELRWLFGIRAIDQLLIDFGYNEDQKLALLENLKIGFAKEFGMNKHLKKQLDKKFRNQHDKIKNFLKLDRDIEPEYAPIIDVLEKKSIVGVSIIKSIKSIVSKTALDDLLGSYIHMLMNRLFRSKNRLHEMVVYDLLYRVYKVEWCIRTFKNKKSHNIG